MKAFLIPFIVLLLVSCGRDQVAVKVGKLVKVTDVPTEISLHPADSITGPFLDGITGIRCVVKDSFLVAFLTYDLDNNFRVLNIKDNSFIDFLARGRGPGEALTGYFSAKREENGNTYLDVSALNEDLLMSIDLSETLKESHAVIAESSELIPMGSVSFRIGDKILSEVIGDKDIYSMKLYDKDHFKVDRSIQPFGIDEYLLSYQPMFSSPMGIKPDGTRLCLAMGSFDELAILDINGNNHLVVTTSDKLNDKAIIEDAIKNDNLGDRTYYQDLNVTENSIFALYLGCDNTKFREQSSAKVHVFSWEGELKMVYHLDKPLYSIAVTDDESALYGMTLEETIYRYELK